MREDQIVLICQEAHFYEDKIVRSTKPRRCVECNVEIPPGEKHELVRAVWDPPFSFDKIKRMRTCKDCLSVRNQFFCNGWIFGEMWDMVSCHIDEMDGQIASSCLVGLTPKARADICDIIEELWKELDELEKED